MPTTPPLTRVRERLLASASRLFSRTTPTALPGADAKWASEAPSKMSSEGASIKASATGPLIAFDTHRRPVWTPRDYASLANEGFMQNAIVYRCVRMIAEAVASVPFLLYAGEDEIAEHPLLRLVSRPNPFQTGPELIEAFIGHLLVSGNAYLEAVAIDGDARPDAKWASEGRTIRELHALRPDRMKVIPGLDGWPEAYEYTVAGRSVRIHAEPVPGMRPILHLKQFHATNDHYGLSPLEAAASAIDLHNTASQWNKALLDNAARPSGALVYTARDGNMTAEQYERLKSELESGFQGSANAGRPLLLEGGLDWKSMSLSPKDMDFIEARHVAAREIALALGVPPMLLGIPGDNTYSNLAEANRIFWRATVLPLANRLATSLSQWLSPAFAHTDPVPGFSLAPSRARTRPALRLVPDLDSLEALASEREALWARLEKANFLSLNEKRTLAGFTPRTGGDEFKFAPDATTKANFNPGQLRVPKHSPGGGQWIRDGSHTEDLQQVNFRRELLEFLRRYLLGDNRVRRPVPIPPILPPPSGAKPGTDDQPEFLRKKNGAGSITGHLDGLTAAERNFATEMRDLGNHVEIIPRADTRTADFKINGKSYELKTISNISSTDADGMSGAVGRRTLEGRGQSGDVIIDARQQAGMTSDIARRAAIRAFGRDNETGSKIQSITILTPSGPVYIPRRP